MATISIKPAKLNYKITRGDDFADYVTIKEGEPPSAVDVSTRTFQAQVRRTPNGPVVAHMVMDETDAATGVIGYSISDVTTADMDGQYVWDFQQITGGFTRTLMAGSFTVVQDVTRDDE